MSVYREPPVTVLRQSFRVDSLSSRLPMFKKVYQQSKRAASSLLPLDLLREARSAVPAVDYALGLVGIAAAAALVIGLVGPPHVSLAILAGMLVAMFLLFA